MQLSQSLNVLPKDDSKNGKLLPRVYSDLDKSRNLPATMAKNSSALQFLNVNNHSKFKSPLHYVPDNILDKMQSHRNDYASLPRIIPQKVESRQGPVVAEAVASRSRNVSVMKPKTKMLHNTMGQRDMMGSSKESFLRNETFTKVETKP